MRTKWHDEDGDELSASRLAWSDLAVVAVIGIEGVLTVLAQTVGLTKVLLQQHANDEVETEQFHVAVSLDIETLTSDEEDEDDDG